MSIILIMGHYAWGKAETLEAAKRNFTRSGGQLSRGYAIIEYGPNSEFDGVDEMGRYYWKGEKPELVKVVKPRVTKS